jgi:hypothetical protein
MKPDPAEFSDPTSILKSEAQADGLAARISAWSARHPILAIAFVSLLAVIINCYPVIFCGKSFVSPVSVNGALVYDWWPPLPGMEPAPRVQQHESDTGAMMWWGVPVGFIEARSIMEQNEIPLWNRYGHAGDILLGQGVSMLGDPLQLIVIIGHGSAGAWDVKFLTGKFIFCMGFGWLILRLLGRRPLSLIYAALAAYCGAYIFIDNHPVFFVLTYAPWILLSAIEFLDVQSGRHIRWGLVWLLANCSCFNGGHLEVAVTMIGGLNLTALAYSLKSFSIAAKVIGRMSVWALLFLGLTAPVWMTFLAALGNSHTAHDKIAVTQLQLASLPGAFEDVFYHLLNGYYEVRAPGTSLLILVGCLFSALRWRQLKTERFFWINVGAVVLWGGFVFGWVPAFFIAAIPFLNHVGHIHADFSFLLVIHLTIQSAYGFKSLEKTEPFRRALVDFILAGAIVEGIVLAYCSSNRSFWFIHYYICFAGAGAIGAPVLFKFLKCRHQRVSIVGWATILFLGFIPNFRFGLYTFGAPRLMMLPGPRAVLDARSEGIKKIEADTSAPFRIVGLGWVFVGDYSAVYGLEDIRSCAPLSSKEFIELIRNFPGMRFNETDGWLIEVIDPVQARPLLNLLNVKYLLANPNKPVSAQSDFSVADRSDFLVLSNSETWPRAFFSSRIIPISSNEDFTRQLLQNGNQPFIAMDSEEIKQQSDLQTLAAEKTAVISPATNYHLRPNSTAFVIHAPTAGVVCLTEGQAKDFIATANDEPKPVLTVNRAFKGIYLNAPGNYHIEFTYRPRHWRIACLLFWSSIFIAFALTIREIMRAQNRQKSHDLITKN